MAQKKTTADPEAKTTAAQTDNKATETEAQPKKLTLTQKVLAVKNSIGKVTKDGSGKVGSEQKGNQKEIRYATLTNVLEKLTPALAEYGVDYVVAPVWSELAVQMMAQGYRFFSIHLIDAETGEITEPVVYPFHLANNPEAIKADGSTFTYVTRYLLGLVFGIQTEVDPDAQQQRNQQPQQKPQQKQPPKVRTFKECATGFYATYNKGDLDGAKRTLDFIVANWGDANKFPDFEYEINLIKAVDLSKKPQASAPAPEPLTE